MMTPHYVLATDSRRARLFRVIRRPGAGGADEVALRELESLVHPQRGQLPSEALSDSRPGVQRSSAPGGPGHAVSDRREGYYDELDRRFARQIVEMLGSLEERPTRLTALASPSLIGLLRSSNAWSKGHFEVQEVAREVSKASASELCAYLEREGLLT